MVMQAMRTGRASKALKYVLFSFLILGMVGLVFSDIGGFFRGGVVGSDVAKVGDKTISINAFDKNVRRTLGRMNIPPQQAYQMGFIDQILDNEIRNSIMTQTAKSYGIEVGRTEIAKQIDKMLTPMTQEGGDKKAVLNQILTSQGFTENEFVTTVSGEVATALLATALQNGYIGGSETLAKDLYQFQHEKRDIELIDFKDAAFVLEMDPPEADLKTLYEALKEQYATPESRTIRVGVINQDNMKSSIEISDDAVRAAYDDDIESFKVSEQRVLEQAIAQNEIDAKKIFEAAQKGEALQKAAEKVTGKKESYLAAQGFEENGMIEQIKAPVFAGKKGDIIGPIETPLGFHVIKISDIKAPETKSFESVKEQIKKNLLETELADLKFEASSQVEDLAASGATLDDVAKDVPMDIKEFKDISPQGAMASAKHPLDVYGEDAAQITQTAFEIFEGDISQVIEMKDGKMAVVTLSAITPKTYKPYEEVKPELVTRWTDEQKRMDNRKTTLEILTVAGTEGKSLETIAKDKGLPIKSLNEIKRDAQEKIEPLTPASLAQIFEADEGEMIAVDTTDGIAIARVKSITLPDLAKAETKALEGIKAANIQSAQQEGLMLFLGAASRNFRVSKNEAMLQRAYGTPAEPQ